jgi:hypothetical protein
MIIRDGWPRELARVERSRDEKRTSSTFFSVPTEGHRGTGSFIFLWRSSEVYPNEVLKSSANMNASG